MFTSNFSDRFKKAMSGFQKAHDDLSILKADIAAEKKAADEHVTKLVKTANQVDSALAQLKPFISAQ